MPYCQNCGTEVKENQDFCLNCGTRLRKNSLSSPKSQVEDTGSNFGWGVLGFFVPIAGLILFIVWKPEHPGRAKAAGLGALISVITAVVVYVLIVIFFIIAVANSNWDYAGIY